MVMQIVWGILGVAGYSLAVLGIWQDEWSQIAKARFVGGGLGVAVLSILCM
jgi:hypothetical protein